MACSLSNLVNNLAEAIHKIKCKYENDDKKCETCRTKYEYCGCFLGGKVKHELRVASYEFKSTSYELKFTSYEFKCTSCELKFMSYEFYPRVTSSNPQVRRLKARVARLKARAGRLKARVRRLKG